MVPVLVCSCSLVNTVQDLEIYLYVCVQHNQVKIELQEPLLMALQTWYLCTLTFVWCSFIANRERGPLTIDEFI